MNANNKMNITPVIDQ